MSSAERVPYKRRICRLLATFSPLTTRQVARALGTDYYTASSTLRVLLDLDVLRRTTPTSRARRYTTCVAWELVP